MKLRYKYFFALGILLCFTAVAENKDGNYNVPVENEDLVQSSDYESDYNVHERDGEIDRIKYDLPIELTGEYNKIEIYYTGDAEFPWSGDLAKGDCHETDGQFTCNLVYEKEKLVLDSQKAETAIRSTFAGSEEEIQRRLQVAEIFRSEPAGIASFYR